MTPCGVENIKIPEVLFGFHKTFVDKYTRRPGVETLKSPSITGAPPFLYFK